MGIQTSNESFQKGRERERQTDRGRERVRLRRKRKRCDQRQREWRRCKQVKGEMWSKIETEIWRHWKRENEKYICDQPWMREREIDMKRQRCKQREQKRGTKKRFNQREKEWKINRESERDMKREREREMTRKRNRDMNTEKKRFGQRCYWKKNKRGWGVAEKGEGNKREKCDQTNKKKDRVNAKERYVGAYTNTHTRAQTVRDRKKDVYKE